MAVSTVERSTTAPAGENRVPAQPLNNGDRLTRAEFETHLRGPSRNQEGGTH